jgi:hypothetical protein
MLVITVYQYIILMYLFEAIYTLLSKLFLIIYAVTDALGTESVFIGFAIHKIINWNPESTTDSESGIQGVGSRVRSARYCSN